MFTSLEKSVNSKMRRRLSALADRRASCVNIQLKLLSIGGYLFIEGWASIARSQDQRGLSNIGRL